MKKHYYPFMLTPLLALVFIPSCDGDTYNSITITYVGESSYTGINAGGSYTFELPFTLSRELSNDEKMDAVRFRSWHEVDASGHNAQFAVAVTSLSLTHTITLTTGGMSAGEGSCTYRYSINALKSSGETFGKYVTTEITLNVKTK